MNLNSQKQLEIKARNEKIYRLRQQGCLLKEIADVVGVSRRCVYLAVCKFEVSGVVFPLTQKQQATKELQDQVANLRGLGYSALEIAKTIGKTIGSLGATIKTMVAKRKIPRLLRGRKAGSGKVNNLADPWTAKVLALVNAGDKTQAEIGKEMGGITRQAISIFLKRIEMIHESKVVKPDHPFWTIKDASRELGVSCSRLTYLCRKRMIPFIVRGKQTYLFAEKDMKILRDRFKKESRVCRVCQKVFKVFFSSLRKTCGKSVCKTVYFQEMNSRRYKKYMRKSLKEIKLQGWRAQLASRLEANCVTSKNECWLPLGQAKEISGLTAMWLKLLGSQGMVKTRSSKKLHSVTHRPILLFAKSQVEIAGQVYREFLTGQAKK